MIKLDKYIFKFYFKGFEKKVLVFVVGFFYRFFDNSGFLGVFCVVGKIYIFKVILRRN